VGRRCCPRCRRPRCSWCRLLCCCPASSWIRCVGDGGGGDLSYFVIRNSLASVIVSLSFVTDTFASCLASGPPPRHRVCCCQRCNHLRILFRSCNCTSRVFQWSDVQRAAVQPVVAVCYRIRLQVFRPVLRATGLCLASVAAAPSLIRCNISCSAFEGIGTIVAIESSMRSPRKHFPRLMAVAISCVLVILCGFGTACYGYTLNPNNITAFKY
jgi:hypothetical protein